MSYHSIVTNINVKSILEQHKVKILDGVEFYNYLSKLAIFNERLLDMADYPFELKDYQHSNLVHRMKLPIFATSEVADKVHSQVEKYTKMMLDEDRLHEVASIIRKLYVLHDQEPVQKSDTGSKFYEALYMLCKEFDLSDSYIFNKKQ
jgi:hypothetical protein